MAALTLDPLFHVETVGPKILGMVGSGAMALETDSAVLRT
jgi:hypothetical protein